MKIGVWLSEKYSPKEGGGFSYYDILIESIDKHNFKNVEIVFISTDATINGLQKEIVVIPYVRNILYKIFKFCSILIPSRFSSVYSDLCEKWISDYIYKKGVKVIFYPIQGNGVLTNFPFISNNWDIGHRATYAFPELVRDYNFKIREKWYFGQLYRALLIFCESEAGKQELIRFTGLSEEKIKVLPSFAGRSITKRVEEVEQVIILQKFNLKKHHYFFYPAQFWAHKNHFGLLRAFAIFLKSHQDYKLIFTGSDKGNGKYLKNLVSEMNLEEEVVFGGFVELSEISTFYINAAALVMPSFFGPTNMPLLEALVMDCPVLCSDLIGHREIMSDAALYFSPSNHNQIAQSMQQIIDENVRGELLVRAKKVYGESKFNIDTAISKMDGYFSELVNIRKCWE